MKDHRQKDPVDLVREHQLQHLPVSVAEIFYMFAHIVNDGALFAEARRLLRPDLFEQVSEGHFRVFWSVVLEFYEHYQSLNYAGLHMALTTRLRFNSGELTQGMQQQLFAPDWSGLLFYCCHYQQANLVPAHGRDVLKRFLSERAVIYPLRTAMQKGGGSAYLQNFDAMVDAVNAQRQQIASLQDGRIELPFPKRSERLDPPVELTPTGLDFFDTFIRGQRVGDCNGILGVYGSGKTTLAMQLAISNARRYHLLATETSTQPKLSVFVSYEEPAEKTKRRIWANAAQIKYDKLERMRDFSELSRQDCLEPYEHSLRGPVSPANIVLSETDRWDIAEGWMNRTFRSVDFSGTSKPGVGSGYIDELVGMLARLENETGSQIGAVHIDYAKLMVQRYMDAQNMPEERMRHFVGKLGNRMTVEVASRFKCTVWLFHQFAPTQATKSPTVLLNHADASEAKAFAEHLACCGCLGVRDKVTGCVLLNWSKNRYNQDPGRAMPVLQIDGDFCRLVDVSNRYVPDSTTRTFVDPTTRYQLEGQHVTHNPISRGPDGMRVDTFLGG